MLQNVMIFIGAVVAASIWCGALLTAMNAWCEYAVKRRSPALWFMGAPLMFAALLGGIAAIAIVAEWLTT